VVAALRLLLIGDRLKRFVAACFFAVPPPLIKGVEPRADSASMRKQRQLVVRVESQNG
jgi:hypothetical protein